MRRPSLLFALSLPVFTAAGAQAATSLTVEQAMADPDWIGPPVEQAWWAWDGRRVHYTLKRKGSPLRDTWAQAIDGERGAVVADEALASLDAALPVYDRARARMLFLRNGDVFLRDLRTGALTQITRSVDAEEGARFDAQGGVMWRLGNDWYGWRADTRVVHPLAVLKTEKDPDAPPDADYLREMQLRLIATLKKEKDDRDAAKAQAEAQRSADPTRAPSPVYLGEDLTVTSSALSPAGRWLLVATEPKGENEPGEDTSASGQAGKMPKYVTESGYEEVEDVRTRVGRNPPSGQTLRLIDLSAGKTTALKFDPLPGIADDPLAALRKAAKKDPLKGARPLRVDGIEWSDDGAQAAVMLRAVDNKDRWIATVDLAGPKLRPQHRLTDAAWIGWDFNEFGWLPDNRTLWLLSEESGYGHLYTLTPGGRAKRITEGKWEVTSPEPSADGRAMLFLCNRQRPGDYEVCAVDLAGGAVRELTALDGVESFAPSPDGSQLLLRWSASYTPPQLAVVSASGGEARKLTDTRTPEFRARQWIAPEFVQVPSKHGAGKVWGKLYRPASLEPGRQYPVVLFVHGAGYLQNVSARYPNYFREQMFHNVLVQGGYLVLDLDYRASSGYGRDWRTAIYRQMGHPELEDYLDGIDWLVEHHQGDRARVGIYGGSYGGFMAFMAMFRAPEAFRAGAALRPVTDWTQYNHEYTANILNTPDIDPEAYRKSSPIEFAEGLRGELLICHGMIDDNVFFQDSVRLTQRLIELRKDGWTLAPYPLERHSFVQPDAWFDEYRRIHKLFERTLK